MKVFPAAELKVDLKKIEGIKRTIDKTLRLITFSREHLADDLLDAYLTKTTRLKDLLSIKNAQMEWRLKRMKRLNYMPTVYGMPCHL
ncbi:MAG: hypothetical protein ACPF9D_04260 [Owenweeksia sp.]